MRDNELSIDNLDDTIHQYMSKISQIITQDINVYSLEKYAEAFLKGFSIDKHNILKENENGILCYDLMICQNPLEIEKKQFFFTFFSTQNVFNQKKKLANLYQKYLDDYPEYHIDTMLQICYSDKYQDTTIQNGFCLKFDNDSCQIVSLTGNQLSIFHLDPERNNIYNTILEKRQNGSDELLIREIEGKIDEFNSKESDEDSNYTSYSDAFLNIPSPGTSKNRLKKKQIAKNVYRVAFINEIAVPGIKRMYFIPIPFPNKSQIGHFVLSTNGNDLDKDLDYIKKFKALSFVLLFPVSQINLSSIYINKARFEAIKSAKAAIMSRNMSHNLGSHVMFYIKQRLQSVEKIIGTGALKDLVAANSIEEIDASKFGDTEMPFLVGLGRFINYLQERQDFIATIATNYIPYFATINFKDAIYDELKPEKKAIRHNQEKGQKAANLLLAYIANSEGFTKSDDINLYWEDTFFGDGNVPDDLRTFNIALPGGNLGRQAFFSIMENIIRNTAKHDGKNATGNKLVFQFDIIEPNDIDRTINNKEIFKYSLCKGQKEKDGSIIPPIPNDCYSKTKDDLFYLGITVKIKQNNVEKTIEKIGEGLVRNYLTDNDEMDDECKGIKEMRISAAWLRGWNIDTDITEDKTPAVAVRKNGDYVQYIIGLPKPKRVAIVSEKKEDKEMYHERGCMVFRPASDESEIKKINRYDLIVYDGEEDDAEYQNIKYKLHSRIFAETLDDEWIKKIDELYKKWIEKLFPISSNTKISIIDDKVEESVNISNDVKGKIYSKKDTSETNRVYYEGNIVFNTHYAGQASPNLKGDKSLFSTARFVEAISGGNSTDRLIRHDERNMLWYCKHIATGLTKIAIFDERLYKLTTDGKNGIDKELTIDKDRISEFLKTESKESCSLIRLLQKMTAKFHFSTIMNDIYGFLKTKEINADNFLDAFRSINKDYSETWRYIEKGIWTFNIIIAKIEEKSIIKIIGYNYAPTENGRIGLYSDKTCEETIAHIIKKEDDKIEVILMNDDFHGKFDFITIHQGLLDKIYGALGIDSENVEGRESVTKALFDAFSRKTEESKGIEYKINGKGHKGYFLPQFVVHSGRSKPNHKDMPQHLPFLQFTAVDHALRDCKYILTELLYSAHYE